MRSEGEDRLDWLDRGMKQLFEGLAETQRGLAETQRRLDSAGKRIDSAGKRLDDAGKRIDDLGLAEARLAEGLVAPSLKRVLRRFDLDIDGYAHRVSQRVNGDAMEVDILAHGQRGARDVAVAVETKTFLRISDIDRWVERLKRFRDFYPLYRAHDLYGAMAGMQFQEGAVEQAERQGLILLGPSEDVAEVANSRGFRPKLFSAGRRARRSPG
jgi:hypothetical protein